MKALTICQPWAWAIVHGRKRVENRTWHTNHRGPLLIHAGKSREWFTRGALEQIRRQESRAVSETTQGMEFGAIVATCVLVDCVPASEATRRGLAYVEGPWCLLLEDVRPRYPAILWRGEMGLFDVPADVLLRTTPKAKEQGGLFDGS